MRYTNWKLSLPFTLNSSYWRPDHLHKCHYLAGLPSILVFTYLHLGFKSKRRLFHHQPQAPVVGSAAFFRSVRTSYVTFGWCVRPQEFLLLLLQNSLGNGLKWRENWLDHFFFTPRPPPPLPVTLVGGGPKDIFGKTNSSRNGLLREIW